MSQAATGINKVGAVEMLARTGWAVGLVSLMLLGGCSSMSPIIDAKGVKSGPETGKGVSDVFVSAEASVHTAAAAGAVTSTPRQMLTAGFDLINANCSDYFRSAGDHQSVVTFTRDATVAGATFATAVMSFNPRNKSILGIVPLAAGGIYGGLDVYNKDFLFSADNIDAVHTLVQTALTTHQTATLTQVDADTHNAVPLTYGKVVEILEDDQEYCMPPRILQLVRKAIKDGVVEVAPPAAPQAADTRSADQQKTDADTLKALGGLLNPPGALTLAQASALYWLFESSSTPDEKTHLAGLLTDLQGDNSPFSGTTLKTSWALQSQVEGLLTRLSVPTVAGINATITAYKKAQADKASALEVANTSTDARMVARMTPLAAKPVPFPDFSPDLSNSYRPITVDVR